MRPRLAGDRTQISPATTNNAPIAANPKQALDGYASISRYSSTPAWCKSPPTTRSAASAVTSFFGREHTECRRLPRGSGLALERAATPGRQPGRPAPSHPIDGRRAGLPTRHATRAALLRPSDCTVRIDETEIPFSPVRPRARSIGSSDTQLPRVRSMPVSCRKPIGTFTRSVRLIGI